MAKRLLKNENEVRNYLIGNKGGSIFSAPLTYALDYTMQKIVERNRELVLRIVYDAYSPNEYERTMEFLNSWTYKLDSGKDGKTKASGEFFQDPDTMSLNNDLAQHGSPAIYGQDWWQDAREYLADIIYNGKAGPLFGRGPWTRKRDAWKPLMKTVESKIYKWYADGLRVQGIVVK